MNEETTFSPEDAYVQRLSKAREARAVIKTEFATWASGIPTTKKIFAFEGRNDKCVYFHWVRAASPDIAYEAYVCRNKDNVLKLFDSLQLDLTGMDSRVFYFVDRDFDGLQGRLEHDRIFITRKYSIENYLVDVQVLDDILCVTFHCQGAVLLREKILGLFCAAYDSFLRVTEQVNFRLYVAKRHTIGRAEELSAAINDIANVGLMEVGEGLQRPSEIVKLVREPVEGEIAEARERFSQFDPRSDYRGKFAWMFFIKWLDLLRRDRHSGSPVVFSGIAAPEYKVNGAFTFEGLAAFGKAPEELVAFLKNVPA